MAIMQVVIIAMTKKVMAMMGIRILMIRASRGGGGGGGGNGGADI